MRPGIWEILLVIVLIMILFVHNKIPGLMKNLANGITIFKKEIKNNEKHQNKTENKKIKKVSTKKVVKK
ncbi:MAG: twin-arginine translocase TatA/TatE family subunit [Alphaproteobacteria bacterium]|nr:twin-arginine translocase TatA/TatE family subunit [Alphaproteobacteria bacterium]